VADDARDPAEVARLVVSLFEARRPRLRHPVGPDARVRSWLLRLAPFGLVERIVGRLLRTRRGARTPGGKQGE